MTERPLVDPKVYALAETWLSDYVKGESLMGEYGDSLEDATWDLSDDIQHTIEAWIQDAVEVQRIKEKP